MLNMYDFVGAQPGLPTYEHYDLLMRSGGVMV